MSDDRPNISIRPGSEEETDATFRIVGAAAGAAVAIYDQLPEGYRDQHPMSASLVTAWVYALGALLGTMKGSYAGPPEQLESSWRQMLERISVAIAETAADRFAQLQAERAAPQTPDADPVPVPEPKTVM